MRPTHRPAGRATVLAVVLVALVLLAQLPAVWAAAPYVGVLDLLCSLLALATGWRIWAGGGLEPLLVGTLVVCLALAGQVLATTLGLPGASPLHGFHAWDGLVTAVDAAAAALLARALLRPDTAGRLP